MWGEYVKLNETGEVVKNEGYDPIKQIMTIKSGKGIVSDVHAYKVSRMTGHEEFEFLKSQEKKVKA
jgi:hypothetical protein